MGGIAIASTALAMRALWRTVNRGDKILTFWQHVSGSPASFHSMPLKSDVCSQSFVTLVIANTASHCRQKGTVCRAN